VNRVRMIVPEWAKGCDKCLVITGLLLCVGPPSLLMLHEYESAVDHVMLIHTDHIPGYAAGCGNCQEWRLLLDSQLFPGAAPEHRYGEIEIAIFNDLALRHRAGHLLIDWKEEKTDG
jgi:hypothetical protein